MLEILKGMKVGESVLVPYLDSVEETLYSYHWARMEMMGKAAFEMERIPGSIRIRKEMDMGNGDFVDNSKFMAGVTSAQKELRWERRAPIGAAKYIRVE